MSLKQTAAAAANATARAKRVAEIKAAVKIKPASPFAEPRAVFPFEDADFQRRFKNAAEKMLP